MRFVLPYTKNSTPIYMSVEKMVEPRRGVIVVDVHHMINAQKLSYVITMVQKENLHLQM